ncbi:MAG TPA: alpha-glucan family phosphorylase [Candidatus Woesearchaeota archaeon]|nr:alpha-glucan family phosphorylase [Candidatus Woesearchaeota archaeon]
MVYKSEPDALKECVAYFSMEIGISHKIPTYSGGLGILAGDLLKSFADMKIAMIAVTLLNNKGYFNQKIDHYGNQIEEPVNWNPKDHLVLLPNEVYLTIEGRNVKIKIWKGAIYGISGYAIPVYFLDTNCKENNEYDKTLTSYLYGGDKTYRLCQEMILGIGGIKALESLGYKKIKKYHLNEGHAALLTIELLKKTYKEALTHEESYSVESVKEKCIFTTHTPVAAGHDVFDISLFKKLLGNYVPEFIINKISPNSQVSMTLLGLYMSKYVNGVAKRHKDITKEMFPEYNIDSITNGIHPMTWISPSFKNLYEEYIPCWAQDPFSLRYALSIPKERISNAHTESKMHLLNEIKQSTGASFHHKRFTIGFARRFTQYKRPDLLFTDINKLKQIAQKLGDIQIVLAGKAHPNDTKGKELIKHIISISNQINQENSKLKIVFIQNYDMRIARLMISGSDLWLNTPKSPNEASGTSGMKAALNGVPQISTLDGWWLEGHIENVTGWSIGPVDLASENNNSDYLEAKSLYDKLENTIIPTFYSNTDKWIEIMRHSIAINASFFNTYRMAQQYIANAYHQ